MAYGAPSVPKPVRPGPNTGSFSLRSDAPPKPAKLGPNFGGLPSVNGQVGLGQAYKNLTSQPNYAGTHGSVGQYIGAPGARPVNMAQAYGNEGGQLPGYTYAGGPAGTWTQGPTPPAQTGGTSGQANAPAAPDYLTSAQSDPQYLAQTAENAFKVNNAIGGLQQTLGFDETNLQAALAKLAYQQPRDALSLEQRANSRGGLYSSVEGQQQGNLAYQYAGKQGGLTDNFARTKAGITSKIGNLQNSIPLYNANALAAAIARAQKNLPPGPAAPTPGGGGPAAPGAPGAGSPPKGSPTKITGKPVYNHGGYAGVQRPGGPVPVDLAQAFGNKGGTLTGSKYFPDSSGAGQWSYVGTKGPVNLAQAYKNLSAKKGKGK